MACDDLPRHGGLVLALHVRARFPSQPGMKRDMGGAAAILGAFQAAVKAQLAGARPLHALLCLAENSVAANATRPDDVHTLYSGRTVRFHFLGPFGGVAAAMPINSALPHARALPRQSFILWYFL